MTNPAQRERRQLIVLSAIGGAVAAGLAALLVVVLVIANGWYDVAASRGHSAPVAWLLHTTMIQSVKNQARNGPDDVEFSDAQVQQGFQEYDSHCLACHGAPGIARAQWTNGITPTPPYIIDAARHWTPKELHFIVANGIKMTAMPAWNASLSPEQITSLVAFLEKLPDIMPSQYETMRGRLHHRLPPATSGQAPQLSASR